MSYVLVSAVYAAVLPLIERAGAVSLQVEKAVLVRLAERADQNGRQIWQSQRSIAEDCQMSERSVRAAMAQLEDRGLLVQVRKANPLANRAAEFRIDLDLLVALRRPDVVADAIPAPDAAMGDQPIATPLAAMDAPIPERGAGIGDTIPAGPAAMQTFIPAAGSYHTGATCRSIPAGPAGPYRQDLPLNRPISHHKESEERVVAPAPDELPLLDISPLPIAPIAKPKRKSAKAPDLSADEAAAFEEFWKACPKRQAKPVAQQAYASAIEGGASVGQLLIAMRRYAEQVRADGTEVRFIKTPGPWLNAKRYLDEYPDDLPNDGQIRSPPFQSSRQEPASYFQAARNVLDRTARHEEQF